MFVESAHLRGICNYRSYKGLLFFLTILILQVCICILCSVSFVNSLINFRLHMEPSMTTHILTFWITSLYIHVFKKTNFAYIVIRPLKFFSLFIANS